MTTGAHVGAVNSAAATRRRVQCFYSGRSKRLCRQRVGSRDQEDGNKQDDYCYCSVQILLQLLRGSSLCVHLPCTWPARTHQNESGVRCKSKVHVCARVCV